MDLLLKGTPLSQKEFENSLIIEEHPKLQYAWDNGIAIQRYLDELKEGRLIGRYCKKCERIMIPPRMFCELCFRATDEWIYLKDTGTLNTFSICYIHFDASRIKEGERPIIPAVIEIDGASPGMGILHLLGEIEPDPKKIKIGMRVKAVWKPKEQRTGSITDILYFKPIE